MIELKRALGISLDRTELGKWRAKKARARLYAYLGPDAALTQLYDGQFIVVDPQDEDLSAQIIARGYWEAGAEEAVLRMLKPGDTVVEVGANVGYYTLLMAAKIKAAGRIFTFEANPRLAALLQRSIGLNDRLDQIQVFPMALGDARGETQFIVRRRGSGGGHVGLAGERPQGDAEAVTAPIEMMDLALPFYEFDLMRLDAEGSEPQIIRRATFLIRRSPNLKICMEWDLVQMRGRGDPGDLIDLLTGEGFKFWKIELDATLSALTRQDLLSLPHSNIVAARSQPF